MNISIKTMIALAALAAPLAGHATPRYNVTVLGTAGSSGVAINAAGLVAGRSLVAGLDHAVVYGGGPLVDLGTLGGATSYATGINDLGQVIGTSYVNGGDQHGFLYSGGAIVDLGTLGGNYSDAAAINNAGVVVGSAATATGNRYAYSYSGGALTNLGSFNGGEGSAAYGINNAGQITGVSYVGPYHGPEYPYHAFIYENGALDDINADPLSFSQGRAIAEGGAVVGDFSLVENFHVHHGFLYADGVTTDLGVLPGGDPLFDESVATDINGLGQIVGHSTRYEPGHAFLFEAGALTTLDSLVDPTLGWTLTGDSAINDAQQIATTACRNGDCYAVRLDLITAVPEPASLALLLAGLGGLGLRLRARRARQAS